MSNSSIRASVYNDRTTLGSYDSAGDYVSGWVDVYDDATRAMCHLARGPLPAQDVYALLGPLSAGTQRLPQLLNQIAAGLADSLTALQVVDDKRDPKESVREATEALHLAAHLIRDAEAALGAVHVAINSQYSVTD